MSEDEKLALFDACADYIRELVAKQFTLVNERLDQIEKRVEFKSSAAIFGKGGK
jgi:tetrahydromethanopterin S-methyltransferase subunit G